MPACYHEFLAVQKGHGSPGIIYGNKKEKIPSQTVINHYQFCGVRNVLHLYPLTLKVEIIYKNNAVITESDFSFLFQVIDIGLVETITTNVMHIDRGIYDPTENFVAGATLTIVIFQIIVSKLNEIILKLTPGNEKYIIYLGPIVDEQFRVKSNGGSVKIPSFQCTIVVYTKPNFLEGEMEFVPVSSNLPVYSVKLEEDKETAASLSNTKCIHTEGRSLFCGMMVSLLTMMRIEFSPKKEQKFCEFREFGESDKSLIIVDKSERMWIEKAQLL